MRHLRFDRVHRPGGWLAPGVVTVDGDGFIAAVADRAPEGAAVEEVGGVCLPGIPNLHSHAFQRLLAGWGEVRGPGADSFWTWRQHMYDVAGRLDPDGMRAVAAMAFVEMLESGMTAVGEFHYLHHGPGGEPYADPAAMARAVLEAAEATGIAVTLLPVAYLRGGIDREGHPRPVEGVQRRFACAGAGAFLELWEACRAAAPAGTVVGVAPHSLRAVDPEAVPGIVGAVHGEDAAAPVHVHAAEQPREVEEVLRSCGARPVRWLLDRAGVDGRWCVVHATWMDPGETADLARSGAVAGLCPTTEASLGDGVFPAVEYLAEGGRFGIGSDSQVRIDATEELRLLEWGQRLQRHGRNLLTAAEPEVHRHVGRFLFDGAVAGGARALGQPVGALEPGRRADMVVLDPGHSRLAGHGADTVLDAFVLSAGREAVRDVFVAGRPVVRGGRHLRRDAVARTFAATAERHEESR